MGAGWDVRQSVGELSLLFRSPAELPGCFQLLSSLGRLNSSVLLVEPIAYYMGKRSAQVHGVVREIRDEYTGRKI